MDPARPQSRVRPPVRLSHGSTTAEFEWAGDRWRHVVTTASARWVSLEGPDTDDPHWPASPVLVEVTTQPLPGGTAVLGVGLVGRSHCSLSVRPCPDLPDTLVFEAACRLHDATRWVGSSYRGEDGGIIRLSAPTVPTPATVAWSYRIGPRGVLAGTAPVGSPGG